MIPKPNSPSQGSIDPWRELPAMTREGARSLRELYVALVREGFTSGEAIKLLAEMVKRGGEK